MRILVIGAGAMGSIYGARLSVHDEVTLIDTNSTLVDKINKDGVILEEAGVEQVFHPAAAVSVAGLGKMDLVILFTKSLYSDAALKAASPAFGPDTYILTLQNGMGHEEVLSHYVDLDHVLIGTTEDNGRVVEAAHVHHGGTGVTNIGLGKGRDDVMRSRLEASFKAAGFKPVFHEDIRQLVWDKLMVNATLSALTAILQCDIHYIASDSYAWSLCSAMIDECVMTACGEGLSFDVEEVRKRVHSLSVNDRGGRTSIMMDIKNGRKTEVDSITGAVVRVAHSHGLCVPHLEMALSLIHALEGRG